MRLCRRCASLTCRLPSHLLQQRLQGVNALVKVKNPSLLLQLQRAPHESKVLLPAAAQTSGRR